MTWRRFQTLLGNLGPGSALVNVLAHRPQVIDDQDEAMRIINQMLPGG